MKHCPKCGISKPLTDFHLNHLKRDGRQGYCKPCRAEIDHAVYVRNKRLGLRAARRREFDRSRQEWIRSLKLGQRCVDCGGSFLPEAMQWDHLPGAEKRGDVSALRGLSKSQILAEIAKCELVCTNCHVLRTFTRAGWTIREPSARYALLSV